MVGVTFKNNNLSILVSGYNLGIFDGRLKVSRAKIGCVIDIIYTPGQL